MASIYAYILFITYMFSTRGITHILWKIMSDSTLFSREVSVTGLDAHVLP